MYDHEANLIYFHHRYYDPETKRFISEDPAPIDITDPRTINRFTFVNNNPLRFVDPDGRISLEGMFRWAFKQDYGVDVEDAAEVAIKTAEELLPDIGVEGTYGVITGGVGTDGVSVGIDLKPDIGGGVYLDFIPKGETQSVTVTYGWRFFGIRAFTTDKGNTGYGVIVGGGINPFPLGLSKTWDASKAGNY